MKKIFLNFQERMTKEDKHRSWNLFFFFTMYTITLSLLLWWAIVLLSISCKTQVVCHKKIMNNFYFRQMESLGHFLLKYYK